MILESLRKIKQAEAEAKQKTEDAREEAARLVEEAKKDADRLLADRVSGQGGWRKRCVRRRRRRPEKNAGSLQTNGKRRPRH